MGHLGIILNSKNSGILCIFCFVGSSTEYGNLPKMRKMERDLVLLLVFKASVIVMS